MQVQVVTYFVTNKWGSMQERERIFPLNMPAATVQARMRGFITSLQAKGQQVYPSYDVQKEYR